MDAWEDEEQGLRSFEVAAKRIAARLGGGGTGDERRTAPVTKGGTLC